MAEVVFAIPGDITAPTGGYAYARRVLALLPSYGVNARHLVLPASFPAPSASDLERTGRLIADAPADSVLLIDGLAYGAMPLDVIEKARRPIIALVHHPLCLESGLDAARAAALKESEQAALAKASSVIATSPSTARTLADDFAVPLARITVAEPGTDPAPRASGTGTPLQLLGVGAVSPRKGYDVLVRALSELRELDWRLTIAGATDRDQSTVAELRALIAACGLQDRITLAGTVVPATLERFFDHADLFVMPSLYEGYGMALAEAMARGLPIVCTTGGAAAETVPDAAALKVAPGDGDALAAALRTALSSRKLRTRMADASWDMGRTLPTWNETTRRIAAVVMGVRT